LQNPATTKTIEDSRMELIDFRLVIQDKKGKPKEHIYGINIFKVNDVIFRPDKIHRIPSHIEALEGIINLRGRVIPVINLQKKLGFEHNTLEPNYLIITEFNGVFFGFMVHKIKQIMHFSWKDVTVPPPDLKAQYGDLITGITLIDNKEIMLLIDFEKIVQDMYPTQDLLNQIEQIEKITAPKTVLCIDDSKIARKMEVTALSGVGYQVLEAINGQEALQLLKTLSQEAVDHGGTIADQVQLIVCDVEMPVMDGLTFLKELKQIKEFSAIPIIMHSSLSKGILWEKSEKLGASAYLTKFDATALIEMVKKHIPA